MIDDHVGLKNKACPGIFSGVLSRIWQSGSKVGSQDLNEE